MIRSGALVGAVAALAVPGTAAAGTASISPDPRPGSQLSNAVYKADPGEANRLVIGFTGFVIGVPGGSMSGPGTVSFTDPTGVTAGGGCLQSGPDSARCPVDGKGQPSILYAIAELGDGNDRAVVTGGISARSVQLFGGAGNDYLRGGGLVDELSGDAGDDVLQAGDSGTTKLLAGAAPDGADKYVGGDGYETVTYRRRTARVEVRLNGKADDGSAGERDNIGREIDAVAGGKAGDLLTGSKGANTLQGNGGRDVIEGRGGGDVLQAGRGNTADVLRGGGGGDDLHGNAGANRLTGGPGQDTLMGRGGDDKLNAKDRSGDKVFCDEGSDRAKIDRRDFFGFGCEKHTRRSGMAAVLLQTHADLDDDAYAAAFDVGCPADGPSRCVGRFDVFRKGKRQSTDRFSIKRGRIGFAVTELGEGAKVLGDVRLKVVSRNAAGMVVVQRARGHIDPPLEP